MHSALLFSIKPIPPILQAILNTSLIFLVTSKQLLKSFKSNEIFKASDMMVDSLTQLIARIREKKPD